MESNYIDGWNDGVDNYELLIQYVLEKLIEEGVVKDKDIIKKIEKKLETVKEKEFDEWKRKNE